MSVRVDDYEGLVFLAFCHSVADAAVAVDLWRTIPKFFACQLQCGLMRQGRAGRRGGGMQRGNEKEGR